jgi:hypothetical protein
MGRRWPDKRDLADVIGGRRQQGKKSLLLGRAPLLAPHAVANHPSARRFAGALAGTCPDAVWLARLCEVLLPSVTAGRASFQRRPLTPRIELGMNVDNAGAVRGLTRDELGSVVLKVRRPRFECLEALLSEPPMQPACGRVVGRTLIGGDTPDYTTRRSSAGRTTSRNPTCGITGQSVESRDRTQRPRLGATMETACAYS